MNSTVFKRKPYKYYCSFCPQKEISKFPIYVIDNNICRLACAMCKYIRTPTPKNTTK